jgi:thioredoxin:protein disulfide reductase
MIKSFAFAWQLLRALLLAAVGSLVLASPAGAGAYGNFLEPGQAFRLAAEPVATGRVALQWQIAPGYYLYRDRMKVTAVPANVRATVTAPPGTAKQDPNYGTVEVYHEQVRLDVSAPGATALEVTWQGCAEAGLCYPPEQRTFALAAAGAPDIPALSAPLHDLPALASSPPVAPAAGGPDASHESVARPASSAPAGASDDGVTGLLRSRPLLWTVPLFALLGIGLAFTPCVLPMLPIVSSMVVGQQARPRRAFALSLAFVLAMATVYALLGTGAALAGGNLQAVLQNPIAIGATAALFAALSLSMFGWYELQVPAWLRDRLAAASPRGGGVFGAAALGAVSALLVSPCMTAPLAGTLLYIAQTGKLTRGAVLLFALGIGMGLPMLVVSVLGARVLPRPGPWMDRIKAAFGFALLATAVGMLQRIVPASAALVLWGAWLAQVAVAAWASAASGGGRVLARSAALVAGLWAGALVIGASAGAGNPWRPLEPLARGTTGAAAPARAALFETVTDPRQLLQRLDIARGSGEPALVDFSADWCTSCKTLDREVFDDAAVRRALAGVVPVRVDVTAATPAQQALMRQYGVMGPPTVMLFDARGQERRADRLVGEFTASDLLARVQRAQGPS